MQRTFLSCALYSSVAIRRKILNRCCSFRKDFLGKKTQEKESNLRPTWLLYLRFMRVAHSCTNSFPLHPHQILQKSRIFYFNQLYSFSVIGYTYVGIKRNVHFVRYSTKKEILMHAAARFLLLPMDLVLLVCSKIFFAFV